MLIFLKEYFFKRVSDADVLPVCKLCQFFCFLGQFASSGGGSFAFVSTGVAKSFSLLACSIRLPLVYSL